MDAQLFLAHADDRRALLDHGIPVDTALDAPAPEIPRPDVQRPLQRAKRKTPTSADAVLAVLRGTASVATTAHRHGVSKDEVERWIEVFVDAGRSALAKTS